MKRHLQYHWWKYLLAVLLPVIVWCVVFDAAGKPKSNERLRILVIGELLDVPALQDSISVALPRLTDQQLKELTVTQSQPGGLALGELLTARQFDYDILILPQDIRPDAVGQNFFSPLSDQLLSCFSESTLYTETVEDKTVSYGLLPTEGSRFASYLTVQTDCILFFSTESVNLDTANGRGKAGDDAALRVAEYLMEVSD